MTYPRIISLSATHPFIAELQIVDDEIIRAGACGVSQSELRSSENFRKYAEIFLETSSDIKSLIPHAIKTSKVSNGEFQEFVLFRGDFLQLSGIKLNQADYKVSVTEMATWVHSGFLTQTIDSVDVSQRSSFKLQYDVRTDMITKPQFKGVAIFLMLRLG